MDLSRDWYRSEFLSHEDIVQHRNLETELNFYDAIAIGDIDFITKNCKEKEFTNLEGVGKLSDNPIQNLRYHFVVTTAMIARYCIHYGMEQEQAYLLSDFYIQKMDKAQTIAEISELHDVMSLDYCRKMNSIRKTLILSKPVVLCLDYIYSHIHYRITIKELAEYLGISESYLSKLFAKEMGVPISTYITDIKIEKAKNLLQFSDYSITDIANYLSFASQSHFIQVFEKKTGITPNKYRTHNFRNAWEPMNVGSHNLSDGLTAPDGK